jgi:hypothetical protein
MSYAIAFGAESASSQCEIDLKTLVLESKQKSFCGAEQEPMRRRGASSSAPGRRPRTESPQIRDGEIVLKYAM